MALDFRGNLRRPLPLALAIVSGLAVIIIAALLASHSSERRRQREEIARVEATRQQLATELGQHRQAAGTLADLQGKTAAAQADLLAVTQTRDAARAELGAV